jgi:diguanylate cyclase (GGDEF)-like protein
LYEFDLSGENAYYVVEIRLQDFLNYVQIKTLTNIYDYEYELSAISDNVTTKVESNVSNYNNRSVEEKTMYKGIQGLSLKLYSKNNFVDFDVSMSAITLSFLVIGSLTAFGFYISYLIHKNYNYQKESRMDLLTHIPNEKAELSKLIEYEKAGKPYAIFYLDIDDFKSINDKYGHDIGDEVLQKVAKILTLSVDVKDLASRIHGDEFSVIEEGLFTEEEAILEARRIESSLNTTLYIEGYHIDIQVSCGYAIVPLHTNKYDVAIRLSDNKMYEVKRKHKENKRDD